METADIIRLRKLPVESVAERLGLRVSRHRALCPFHDDTHPSLAFHGPTSTFRCYACGAHGNPIDLVMHVLRLPFAQACRWLADCHSVILSAPRPQAPPPAPAWTPAEAARYARFLEHPFLDAVARRFLFDERRIHPRVAEWCRLSSWQDRQGNRWLQIPYFDTEGRLTGLQNRCLVAAVPGVPRFRFPRGSRCGIYNLPVLAFLLPGEPLFVTEGPSDCWAMLSGGHKAIAVPSATLLGGSRQQTLIDLAARHGPLSLHVCPDADAPGEKLFLQLSALAPRLGCTIVRHTLPPGFKDYGQWWASRGIINDHI